MKRTGEGRPTAARARMFVAALLILAALLPLGYSLADRVLVHDDETSDAFLEHPDPAFDECVGESTYMRYHHWELLRGIREDIVRFGQRGDVGLYRCRECHPSRERFCNKCHDAVSLTPDCFDCHYYP